MTKTIIEVLVSPDKEAHDTGSLFSLSSVMVRRLFQSRTRLHRYMPSHVNIGHAIYSYAFDIHYVIRVRNA